MVNSRDLASVMGPVLLALAVTEPLNWGIFAQQSAPITYLNGTILFAAGLALVRAHNLWVWGWPTLVTLTAWVLLFGGLYRMIAPDMWEAQMNISDAPMIAAFGVIATVGVTLTYLGYRGKPLPNT